MSKTLKCWNGRGYCLQKFNDPKWKDIAYNQSVHGNVCAYSRADAVRLIQEYTGHQGYALDNELKIYWSECWGNDMEGIVPERGIWVVFKYGNPPVRLI